MTGRLVNHYFHEETIELIERYRGEMSKSKFLRELVKKYAGDMNNGIQKKKSRRSSS